MTSLKAERVTIITTSQTAHFVAVVAVGQAYYYGCNVNAQTMVGTVRQRDGSHGEGEQEMRGTALCNKIGRIFEVDGYDVGVRKVRWTDMMLGDVWDV